MKSSKYKCSRGYSPALVVRPVTVVLLYQRRRSSIKGGAPQSKVTLQPRQITSPSLQSSAERTQDEVLVGLILLHWLSLQGSEPVHLQHFKFLFLAVENPVNGFNYS